MKTGAPKFDEIGKRLRYDCNRSVHHLLKECDQELISLHGSQWVQFTHPTRRRPKRPDWRQRFFLPANPNKTAIPSFTCSPEMLEFYQYFGGLREQAPPLAGNFATATDVRTVGEVFEAEDFPEFRHISKLPIIFTATTGDAIVLTKKNSLVWCQVETHETPKCANSFPELLAGWVAHHSGGATTYFDSWSYPQET